MRLFKLLVTLVILCFIGIFIYENMQTLTQPVSFKLDLSFLYHTNPDTPPSLPLYLVILISALAGFIIGLALLLKPHFKTRRMLKLERKEKKEVMEKLNLKQVRSESPAEVITPTVEVEQTAAVEKKE
ncbi:hypothetical protein SBDP1_100041 [Syntrophobacter sp. SbD1]|nr:hypothetical protein SBDP1_100041 [Syntrophobacter sp. SbD1]